MKPFSPLYFIKENKSRCILLMFMIFLGWGVYLGGLYASNPYDNWKLPIAMYDEMALISPSDTEEENDLEYNLFCEMLRDNDNVTVLPLGQEGGFNWKTIMGFESGYFSFTFSNVEDFKIFCHYMNIDCDYSNLKNGSMIMSQRFANNQKLNIGDMIDKDFAENILDAYTLDALTNEDGYTLYFINDKPEDFPSSLVFGNGITGNELYELIYNTQKEHQVFVHDTLKSRLKEQFETFNMIYYFIILFLSLILAVTINAAFVGMYQRRNFEFAVYRAIGIPKWQIVGKLVGELLWMDFISLVIGGGIFFLGLYLFNNLMLYPAGLYLRYFHPTALFGLVLCNVTILLPLIATRCRQILKADICEY